ncbi:MAG: ABC-2 family transporter protein [Acidobacteriota bacterium]
MKLALYWEIVKIAFRSRLAYRSEAVVLFVGRVLALFVQVAIWKALLGVGGSASSSVGSITLREMVTYVIVSRTLSVFVSLFAGYSPLWRIGEKIRSGEIAMDLTRPIGLRVTMFFETVGNNLFEIVFGALPMILAGALVFGLDVPGPVHLLLFGIAAVNGLLIYFLLSYMVGLVAFWYLTVWHLERFLNDLILVFSGALIPLWFFPPALVTVSEWLPFRQIFYTPISIYLEKLSLSEAGLVIAQQLAWLGLLLLAERALWKGGVRKLVVQGG